jgi:hypothetical protein
LKLISAVIKIIIFTTSYNLESYPIINASLTRIVKYGGGVDWRESWKGYVGVNKLYQGNE